MDAEISQDAYSCVNGTQRYSFSLIHSSSAEREVICGGQQRMR